MCFWVLKRRRIGERSEVVITDTKFRHLAKRNMPTSDLD